MGVSFEVKVQNDLVLQTICMICHDVKWAPSILIEHYKENRAIPAPPETRNSGTADISAGTCAGIKNSGAAGMCAGISAGKCAGNRAGNHADKKSAIFFFWVGMFTVIFNVFGPSEVVSHARIVKK